MIFSNGTKEGFKRPSLGFAIFPNCTNHGCPTAEIPGLRNSLGKLRVAGQGVAAGGFLVCGGQEFFVACSKGQH